MSNRKAHRRTGQRRHMEKRRAPRLDDAMIDRYFAQAAATVREVVESTRSAFQIPASTRGLVIR